MSSRVSFLRLALGAMLQPALFVVLLFGPAPTWAWPRAWILITIVSVVTVASLVILARDAPELLVERFKPPLQAGQPRADQVVVVVFIATFVAAIAFVARDVFAWRLLPPPHVLVASGGLGLFLAGWLVVLGAARANAFALPVVKRQDDRAQRVVDAGPYAVVRHPIYAGTALGLIGMPLWLGSTAGVLAALVPIAVLVVRIGVEERFLRATLAGYSAYAHRIRWRLVPGVW